MSLELGRGAGALGGRYIGRRDRWTYVHSDRRTDQWTVGNSPLYSHLPHPSRSVCFSNFIPGAYKKIKRKEGEGKEGRGKKRNERRAEMSSAVLCD